MTIWQDLRYAARVLRHAPGFTGTAVTVLALGIGANSAIFSLVDAVLLRPLPFREPGQLVKLWERPSGFEHNSVSPLNYLDWSEQNKVFSAMAAVVGGSRTLTNTSGTAEKIPGQTVTVSFFDLLGVVPVAGRTFSVEDARARASVVVLSERLWKDRFGGDPKLIGKTIMLDSQAFTVIGIVPAQFQILYESEIWTPFVPRRSPEQRRMHYLQVIARLKPGVSIEQARAGMGLIAESIARISPETNQGWGITMEPLQQAMVSRELRVTSLVLAGVAGFVLLMACANIANLLLARGAGRMREIAVRASLGGSPGRIIGQLLTESILLSVLGGAAGLTLASLILRASPALLPPGTLPAALKLVLDTRVIGFAMALTLATGLLFGLAPAFQAVRIPLAEALRAGGRTATGAAGTFRAALAIGEIAVAVMLVAGAGLLLRTLGSLNDVDPGFHADKVLTMYTQLPLKRYPTPETALTFFRTVESEVAGLPGVRSVGLGTNLPLDGWDIGQGFTVVGDPDPGKAKQPSAHYQMVSAKYFETLGISLLRGRAFDEHDTAFTTPACIVNEELVRRYLKGRPPIGRRLSVQAMDPAGPKPVVREIVGVIRQVKVQGLGERENSLEIYVPMAQNPWFSAAIAVRTIGDPMALAPAVKAAVARVDRDQPVTRLRTMDVVAAESIAQPRFRAELVGWFAALSLALAAVGIFGVLAFSVTQRTREFGIRMALGARASGVLQLVLLSGLKITICGIAIGVAGAAALTRAFASLLYGVKPTDPVTFLATPAVLALVALIACAAPAWRAARVDPAVALRQD